MDKNDLSLLWCKQYIDKRLKGIGTPETGGASVEVSPDEPENPQTGDMWFDIDDDTPVSYLVDFFYPVGSIYISSKPANPSALFGGTWQQIKDMFILAAGDTYAAGSTGGEATHTLTVNEMPSHEHGLVGGSHTYLWGDGVGTVNIANATANAGATSGNRLYTIQNEWNKTYQSGGGAAHNNMPPYITRYVWERIA